ncbi:response regulator [Oxalobacteraceae bacterium CAVE-383]|nr:response regulator [Oxalobacteraceae bacterium CAVE-383]
MPDRAPHTILVIDDSPSNIDLLRAILEPHYRVKVATGAERALKIVASEAPPDLILLDILMPDVDGYELCRRIKSDARHRRIPIIFVTGLEDAADEERGFASGGEDYITKPIRPAVVLARVKTHLALYNQTRELETQVDLRTRELQQTRLEIIHRLGRAAEFKDNETGFHVIRMAHFSRLLAEAVGMDDADVLFQAAPMHDIGKIGIPDHILLKPGKLTPEEWCIMQTHATIGGDIIGKHDDPLLAMARTVALSHHEKWDGSGYPLGLKGEDIPLEGRIVAIADVFDALTSTRPYKKPWPVDEAVDWIVAGSGTHFCPILIEPLQQVLPEMLRIKDSYREEGGAQ